MRIRLSSRNNADYRFPAVIFPRMSDQEKEYSSHHPDSLPAFLAVNDPFQTTDVKWIIKNKASNFEADFMFYLVASILVLIPDNPHRKYLLYIRYCKYIYVNVNRFSFSTAGVNHTSLKKNRPSP
jgi:hypothetical protein